MNLKKHFYAYQLFSLLLLSCGTDKTQEETAGPVGTNIDSITTSKNKRLTIFGGAQITIPINFTALTSEEKAKKYPGNNPPQEVYANEDGTISIAFTNTNMVLLETNLEGYVKQTVEGIKQGVPDSKWHSFGVKNINGKNIGVLAFDTPAADGWIYNVMCFTVMNGKLIMYSFNCMVNQKVKWENEGKEIIESFVVVE